MTKWQCHARSRLRPLQADSVRLTIRSQMISVTSDFEATKNGLQGRMRALILEGGSLLAAHNVLYTDKQNLSQPPAPALQFLLLLFFYLIFFLALGFFILKVSTRLHCIVSRPARPEKSAKIPSFLMQDTHLQPIIWPSQTDNGAYPAYLQKPQTLPQSGQSQPSSTTSMALTNTCQCDVT